MVNSQALDANVLLKAVLDTAIDSIITIDEHGIIQSVNAATRKCFGFEESELLGQNVSMLMPSPDREKHDEYIKRYKKSGQAKIIGIGREVTARRKDGTTFPAHLSVSEFKIAGKTYFAGILHDITNRIQVEERQKSLFAEHAHASRVIALGEMASGIAHEVNQPLAAIVSYADASRKILESETRDVEVVKNALKQISEQGQRAGEIIRRLREFVKKKAPNRSTANVNELIKAAIALTTHDAKRYGIELELDFDDDARVLVDRLQVEQVLLNLIRNAIEAIMETKRHDGKILIRSKLRQQEVIVFISDNGVGIKSSEISNVFNAFYTTKEKGTGLGLSISRSIIEAHHGYLELEKNIEEGATFIVRLPVEL